MPQGAWHVSVGVFELTLRLPEIENLSIICTLGNKEEVFFEMAKEEDAKRYFSGSFSGAQWLIGGVCVLLGMLMMSQYISLQKAPGQKFVEGKSSAELAEDSVALYARQNTLKSRQKDLQNILRDLNTARSDGEDRVAILEKQLADAKRKAGFSEIRGEGLAIVIPPEESRITANMLLQLVNELKAADVQAVSINQDRVVSSTEIRETRSGLSVNDNFFGAGEELTILAVGKAVDVYNSLNMIGGILDKWEALQIQVQIDIEENITVAPIQDDVYARKDLSSYFAGDKKEV